MLQCYALKECVSPNIDGANSTITASVQGPGSFDYHENPQVKQLLQKSVTFDQNGVGYVDVPFSFMADLSGSNYGLAYGYVGVDVSVDNRSIALSSPNIETSYYKSFDVPPPATSSGTAHVPNPNGSKTVDSVVALGSNAGVEYWYGYGEFQAQAYNFASPSYKWTLEGGTAISPVSGFGLPFSNVDHLAEQIRLSDDALSFSPTQSTVTLQVKDGDNTTGQTTMQINWHLPYEKTENLPDGNKYRDLYWVASEAIPDGGPAIIAVIPARSFDYEAAIDGVLVLADAAQVPGASELAKVFKVITSIPDWGETQPEFQQSTGISNIPYTFKSALIERPQNISGMTVAARNNWLALSDDALEDMLHDYDCFAGRVRIHHKKNFLADKYDQHGYVSSNHTLSYDVTDAHEFEAFYQPHSFPPVPPELGDEEIPPSYNLS